MSRLCRVMLAGLAAAALTGASAPERGVVRHVTDGDTFRLESGERIRIAGIDAPETHSGQAKCATEMQLGEAARSKAQALLERREVGFERVGRSYNRTVARVQVGGKDVAKALVDIGAARWWPRGKPKPDWCGGRARKEGRR